MRRTLLAIACLLPLAAAAQAPTAAPDPARTVLQLSESAEIAVRQDELHALLAVEARAGTPAAAQDAVNRTMAAVLEKARAVAAVDAATGNYSVWRVDRSSAAAGGTWQASQTLALSARETAPLLQLVGSLQAQGVAVRQLEFRISRQLLRQTRERAAEEALGRLHARAERLASLLGLEFERFATVRLAPPPAEGVPPMAAAALLRSTEAAPPVAEAAELAIRADVGAEAILRPRR